MNSIQLGKMKASLTSLNAALDRTNTQMTTNRKFDKGSEDVVAFDAHVAIKGKINNLGQISRDLSHADVFNRATEQSLFAIEDMMDMTYTEMLKAASNGYYKAEDREIIRRVIGDISAGIIDISNSKIKGQYVFSGDFSEKKPFDQGNYRINELTNLKEYNYAGAETKKSIFIGENVKKEYGITGKELFQDSGLFDLFDQIDGLLSAPGVTINNQLNYDLNNIGMDFQKDLTNSAVAMINSTPLTQVQKDAFANYTATLADFSTLATSADIVAITATKAAFLAQIPGLGDYPDEIKKVYDSAMLIDKAKIYGQDGSNTSFNDMMKDYMSMVNDTNYPTSPYTADEKEKFRFMVATADYKVKLKEYSEQPVDANFKIMEAAKKFLTNEVNSIPGWLATQKDQYTTTVIAQNSNLQADLGLTAPQKSQYDIFANTIRTYLAEPTVANFANITTEKAVLDGLGMAPIYNQATLDMYKFPEFLNTAVAWAPTVLTDSLKQDVTDMFEFTKNPMSSKLKKFEMVRQEVNYMHAELGVKMGYLDKTDVRISQQKLDLDVFYSETVSMDMAEVALTMQATTSSINALYMVISKMQELSLAKYI